MGGLESSEADRMHLDAYYKELNLIESLTCLFCF